MEGQLSAQNVTNILRIPRSAGHGQTVEKQIYPYFLAVAGAVAIVWFHDSDGVQKCIFPKCRGLDLFAVLRAHFFFARECGFFNFPGDAKWLMFF